MGNSLKGEGIGRFFAAEQHRWCCVSGYYDMVIGEVAVSLLVLLYVSFPGIGRSMKVYDPWYGRGIHY